MQGTKAHEGKTGTEEASLSTHPCRSRRFRLRTLLNSSYVAHGSNVTRRQPRILVQKLEFYWSSSLEEPPEGHVYLVAKHLDPKRLFLSKNGSLPPWPNPCPPLPLPSQSSLSSIQILPSRSQAEQNRAQEASASEAEPNRSRAARRDGDPLPVASRRLGCSQFGRLARRGGQNYRSLQGEEFA